MVLLFGKNVFIYNFINVNLYFVDSMGYINSLLPNYWPFYHQYVRSLISTIIQIINRKLFSIYLCFFIVIIFIVLTFECIK